jgi:hypothetical protein
MQVLADLGGVVEDTKHAMECARNAASGLSGSCLARYGELQTPTGGVAAEVSDSGLLRRALAWGHERIRTLRGH